MLVTDIDRHVVNIHELSPKSMSHHYHNHRDSPVEILGLHKRLFDPWAGSFEMARDDNDNAQKTVY